MWYSRIGWLAIGLAGCGPRVGPANASFHHGLTFQFLPAAGSTEQSTGSSPSKGEGAVLDALPIGFRKQSTTVLRGGRMVERPMVGVAEGFPSPDDPHRYLGRLRVTMTVNYEAFRPDDEELSAERGALVSERDRLALEKAAAAGGNAVLLFDDTLTHGKKEDGWWWRGARQSRGFKCDEGGNCVKHWAEYHVLYVSKASRNIKDGKTALAALVPEGYVPVTEGQKLSKEIALPLQRDHCYAFGIALDKAEPDVLNQPLTVRLPGLMLGRYLISGLKQQHTLKLDNVFTRASIAEMACSPITEKQTVKIHISADAPPGVSWSLFAKRMKPDEALKEYCYQCSGEANACGKIDHAACRPLMDCLEPRKVSLAQCHKHYPAAY